MFLTDDFYADITPASGFGDLQKQSVAVPENWSLFITDVKNSTAAIEAGKYKDVNVAGALCVLAIINSEYYRKVPFIFGGDGIMFSVPEKAISYFSGIMLAVRRFTLDTLNLDLRIGITPMRTIYQAGKQLGVGKMKFGHGGSLSVFEGNGIEFAENLIKMPKSDYLLSETNSPDVEVNFDGFSCPFALIPSKQGNVMALIIKPQQMTWGDISDELLTFIGDESQHHPLDADAVSVDESEDNVGLNAAVSLGKNTGPDYDLKQSQIKIDFEGLNRSLLKGDVTKAIQTNMIPASDYKKYDGNYKIVFRCDTDTMNKVLQWLNQQEQNGGFTFGYHLTDRSIMTCLFVGSTDDTELHLIDAADGGYALAAAMLKQKLYKKLR